MTCLTLIIFILNYWLTESIPMSFGSIKLILLISKHPFVDLNLSVPNCSYIKKLDKLTHFGFDIVSFAFLDGDIPQSTSFEVYTFQPVRFARLSAQSHKK